MFYSLLIVAAVGAGIYVLKRWQTLPAKERKDFAKKIAIWGSVGIVLGLVVAGRAHWLMGVLAALLALVGRAAQFAQYIPLFKKILGQEQDASGSHGPHSNGQQQAAARSGMSRQEAADILGIDVNASQEEIKMAHKKLMQKIHPDRGGSDALAKQINQAKDILISD